MSEHAFQAPTGTRDLYPAELNRLRFIQDAWRRSSVSHGFDEIDGPTFEHLDLYTVKSGEGIVSELFAFTRAGGERTYALRPEFTPTLARMYAARAGGLPKPTKWFCTPNFFRAERPQRGRLREFCQWNADIIGDGSVAADAEIIALAVDLLARLGLSPADARVRISHRGAIEHMLRGRGVQPGDFPQWFTLLDKVGKIANDQFLADARALGMDNAAALQTLQLMAQAFPLEEATTKVFLSEQATGAGPDYFKQLFDQLTQMGIAEWCLLNLGIVRGLAYYTGMVFEIHEVSGGERAMAGGGRYDNLIALFGGPPTAAVGFGMGDVVLSLVLADRGKVPSDERIADELGLRPDVYVISNGTPEAEGALVPLLGELRRAGLHARRSYKATRNIGKMLQDAAKLNARYAVILESGTIATLKNLATQEQLSLPINELHRQIRAS